MKRDLIREVFSQLQKGEYVRLAWENEKEKFHWRGTDSYEEFTTKVDELKLNPHIASIWFSPNPSNSASDHTAENVKFAHWLYVDIDDVSPDDFMAEYDFIKPAYTVATGHGVQLYWKLKQPVEMPSEERKAIEKGIERKFNGEKGEPAALLRVPDTFNRKHLIKRHWDKGYTVETECRVIESNDIAYDLGDFAVIDLEIVDKPAEPTTAVKTDSTKLSLTDLTRIRQNCPAINNAFTSIENDKDIVKTVGHNKRIVVGNIIKNTIADENYVLELFGKTSDFSREKTLKHYRSLNKKPFTCATLKNDGLCNNTCQLMRDLNKKSPIVFAYRKGVQLELTNELLNDTENEYRFEELLKRVKSIKNPVSQLKLINRIKMATGLNKQEINRYMRRVKVYDEINSYIVNGEVDPVRAAKFIIKKYQIMRFQQDFYQYSEGIWENKPQEETESLIHHEIEKYSDNHTISEVINAVKRESLITSTQVDEAQDTYVIAANNGLLDVKTENLRDFKPDDYRFRKMAANYNSDANCPAFKEFIKELFLFDTDASDKRKLVQELFGYLLIPDYTLIKKMFYLYGRNADNGKSSLINIVKSVMGRGYFESVALNKLDGFLLKRLQGKHANIVGDQDAHTRVPDGVVKQLIGGMDEVTADVKNKDAIILENYARLIFAVNKLPYSAAKDEGYFTRAVILTFNNRFIMNPDPNDPRQMTAEVEKINYIKENEKDGILNWMLEGLRRVLANKQLTMPASSISTLEDYKTTNNTVLLFVRDECEIGKSYRTGKTALYVSYKQWCHDQGFKRYVNAHTFYDILEQEFDVIQKRTKKSRQLKGIKTI